MTKLGAVPSVPTREEAESLLRLRRREATGDGPAFSSRGGGDGDGNPSPPSDEAFPWKFGSRLNSMKDRPELWDGPQTVEGWVKRQSLAEGLDLVDFNYPQHFRDGPDSVERLKAALADAGLEAGAVCLRYPRDRFVHGAFTHHDPKRREEAIRLTLEAADAAAELGCDEVVVWSAYDGYDYPFQASHDDQWSRVVDAFRRCCDARPATKFSLEFKPTDENTRFFAVPSTAAALLLCRDVARDNFGLVLDVGHMLAAGENPGQSVAAALREKRLFGVQLNDGYTRLGAEDGMMFGTVHRDMCLEVLYHLVRHKDRFRGHLYFDTFPQRTDPVKEAEFNVRQAKRFWKAAERLLEAGLEGERGMGSHDALFALNSVEEAFRQVDDEDAGRR